MKVRIGFVSNSSSSSYLIYGIQIKHESISNAEKKRILSIFDVNNPCDSDDEDENDFQFYDTLDEDDLIYSEDGDTYLGKNARSDGLSVIDIDTLKKESVEFIKRIGYDENKMKWYLLHHIDH